MKMKNVKPRNSSSQIKPPSDETIRVMAAMKVYLKEPRLRGRVTQYVKRVRDTVMEPSRLFGNPDLTESELFTLALAGASQGEILLRRLVATSPVTKPRVEDIQRYFAYCAQLFSLAGIYALEDPFVRLYVFSQIEKGKDTDPALRNRLQRALLSLFGEKGRRVLLRRVRGATQMETLKTLAWMLKKTSGKNRSERSIARDLGISPGTVKKYIEEMENLPDNERIELMKAVRPHELKKHHLPESFDEEQDDVEELDTLADSASDK